LPATEYLYRQLDDARLVVGNVYKQAQALAQAIEQLINDFAERHGASDVEESLTAVNAALSDLTDDAVRDRLANIAEIERQIAAIEQADLRRSSPVVL
jgi:spore cortex formation protein SpoVR/YcgB (stage V sporulation)